MFYLNMPLTIRGLENWLGVVFEVPFKDVGNTFPIGRQEDGHSCGICIVNAIESAMFRVPLFTDKDCYALCVQYFVDAVEYLLDNASILFCTKSDHPHLVFRLLGLHARQSSKLQTYQIQEPTK